MDNRLLFLGCDHSTIDALNYAKSKNIHTIVVDFNSREDMPEKQLANESWQIDLADIDALEKKCRDEGITNLFAGVAEFCVDVCQELSKRLGISFYASDDAWRATRDKSFYKEQCRKVGLIIPNTYKVDANFCEADVKNIKYPVIVKPIDSNAQQGITIVNNLDELKKAYVFALDHSKKKEIVVEDYITGNVVSIFCFVHDGKLTLMGYDENILSPIFDRQNFVFSLHYPTEETVIKEDVLPKLQQLVCNIGYNNGPCVFQGILQQGILYNIECGGRLDGIRSWRFIKKTVGVSQLELCVDMAMKRDISYVEWENVDYFAVKDISLGYVIWSKAGVVDKIEGEDILFKDESILFLVNNLKIHKDVPEYGSMRSIAYVFVIFADSMKALGEKVEEINRILHVYDTNGDDMLIYNHNFYEKWENMRRQN